MFPITGKVCDPPGGMQNTRNEMSQTVHDISFNPKYYPSGGSFFFNLVL
jgi:hypothetical protein